MSELAEVIVRARGEGVKVWALVFILAGIAGAIWTALQPGAWSHSDLRRVGQRVSSEENEATRMTATGRCGIERWSVKVLRDPAARQVNFQPLPTTVTDLNALPAPTLPHDNTTRLASERQTYRVTATLVKYKLEGDSDIHLVISDGGKTMIAEMPFNGCDYGAQHRWAMLVARRKLEAAYGAASGSWRYVGQAVTVTGVEFADFAHGQSGHADNYLELHPVTGFRAG